MKLLRRNPESRFVRSVALALSLSVATCHTWKPTTVTDMRAGKAEADHNLRLYFPNGTVELAEDWMLEYPYVVGRVVRSEGDVRGEARGPMTKGSKALAFAFDLETVQRVELQKTDVLKTTATAVALGVAGAAALVAIIAATKSSCPFVYADDGSGETLIGEGYPGAVFRAIQRDDLLALPVRPSGNVRVRLVNWAPETQYTDRLELALVDHRSGERAVATADARVVLVGPSTSPLSAFDLSGADRLAQVRAADDVAWSTDLNTAAFLSDAPVREGLDVAFRKPAGRPVVELRLKNTKWMEMVFGRVSALMGDRFARYLRSGNESAAADILQWRHRQGVDLRVEALRDTRWETIGYVISTGAVAMRDVALTLPADWPARETLRVRVSGGTGFWRVDSVAVSALLDDRPRWRTLGADSVLAMDGTDVRSIVAATDGRYDTLSDWGQWMEARFSLPETPAGAVRSVFLSTNGYYNPHPPAVPQRSLRTLRRIEDDDAGLARFSTRFYREFTSWTRAAASAR